MAVTPYNQPAIELKARDVGAGARSERSARIEGRPPRAVISWAIRPALMAASLEAEREALGKGLDWLDDDDLLCLCDADDNLSLNRS